MKKGLLFLAVLLMGFAVKSVAQADGEYYLYNAESKCFLSQGEDWGTRACVDKYGVPVLWNSTDGSLKFISNELFLFETNGTIYTDNKSTGFSTVETADGYQLKSTLSGSFLTLQAGTHLRQIVMPTADQSAAAVWQFKTKTERDAMVAAYVTENHANVATAAGLDVAAEDFLNTLSTAYTAVDMTDKIGTARFAGNVGDWTFTQTKDQGGQPAYGTDFCELWQATGYYTQTIANLAQGLYKVTVNGFERAAGWAKCNELAAKEYEISTSTLIANGEQVALKSWFSGKSGDNDPNNTGQAVAKFNEGQYLNEVYAYVGENGELKLTLSKQAHVGDNWVLFNNFTLTHYEAKPASEDIVLQEDVTEELEIGKTYLLGEQYIMYKVRFTAPADGFLNITPSQKVSSTSLKINGASSTFTKDSFNGISKKGMAKGSVFEGTFYCSGTPSADNVYSLTVTFEEGVPYSPLAMTLASPVDGGEWSGAVAYKSYGTKGAPHYEFSSKISKDVKVTVKIGDNVYENVAATVDTYNPKLDINGLPAIMNEAVSAGLVKAGDTFTLTLSNLVDNEFTANTMEDVTFTYTMASTACTGVNPAASTSRTVLPEEVTFSFDGEVKIDNAKFYYVNNNTGEKTELEGVVEGTSVKITVAAVEGMLPKAYDIIAEGVTDANGKVISYGDTEGQLKVSYGTGNGYFKAVAEPTNNSKVASLKTYTFTLPGDVVYDASQASSTEITFGKYDEATWGFTPVEGVTVSYEINGNVITVTLSEEITTPGDYNLEIPSKLFWSKDLYGDGENLSTSTCYYMTSQYITCTILPYGPTAVTPKDGSMVNKLETLVLAFDEEVECDDEDAKVIVSMYQEVETEWGYTDYREVPIAEYYLEYDQVYNNQILVDLGCIDSVGMYTITIPEGSIWTVADKNKKIGEWKYQYQVDPEYWDPEWVVKIGEDECTEEAPYQLIAGRKYEFSEMYSYFQFTAEEAGRVYITPLTEGYNSWTQHDADWMRIGELKETEDGALWFGVAEGETYNLQNYGFNSRQVAVSFEAGKPYDDLLFVASSPADGGAYSKSTSAEYSNSKGYVDFKFSTMINVDSLKISVVLPAKENKEIDITADVFVESSTIYSGGAYVGLDMRDIVEDLKAKEGVKTNDKIQIVLKNVQDVSFAENKLAEDVKIELTIAATVCTSVSPSNSYGVEAIPSEISLRFDGDVVCNNGKGYIIDVVSGEKQEFAIENFACTPQESWDGSINYNATVTLPEATITLTSRKFAIQIEGLADTDGNVVSYGDEAGKFIIAYSMRADNFSPVSMDPEDEAEIEVLKTTKMTFADNVNISPNAYAYFYLGYDEITGEIAVDPNDPKSVIITWSQEITKPGVYYITVDAGSIYDSKYDAEKEDFGEEDGASYNPYLSYSFTIPVDLSTTTVVGVTPEPYLGWGDTPVSQLPAEFVIEFEGGVKEIVSAQGEILGLGGGWDLDDDMGVTTASVLETKLEGNLLYVTIPQADIDALTMGNYQITINAIGEDGKPIGYAYDEYGDYDAFADVISFQYYVEKMLELTKAEPADGSTVKQLDKITLTFSENIFEVDTHSAATLYDENYDEVAEAVVTFEGNVATLTFDPVTVAGTYTLSINEGMFATEEYVGNAEIYMEYIVDPNFVENVDLAIVSATPENGATVANLTTVEFKLNKEVGYLYKSMLIPADGGDDAASASLTQSETDPTSYTLDFTFDGLFANGATLRKDVTYTLTLEAYASEEAWQRDGAHETVTLTYVGNAEAFQYSDVTFESITPAEDFVISDKSQNKFVVKFSGAVNMVEELTFINMGQGATQAFESIVANAEKTEYTLTIAESVLETLRNEVYIVFAANDAEGKRVQGNNGEEENSCFAISFKTVIGVPDLTVTPDAAAEQASLSVLTIGCAEGLAPSWNAGNITLTDANGTTITLNDPEAVVAEGADEWATPTAWTVALAEELKTVGTYTLTIPAGYFNLGKTQGQVVGNKETVVVFNITEAAQGIKGVTVDTDVVVYNLSGVAVAQGKASEVLKNLNKGIYLVNGKKFVVK